MIFLNLNKSKSSFSEKEAKNYCPQPYDELRKLKVPSLILKTDGSHHPEVPSQIDKREFATLIFAFGIVALKCNPCKYSGEMNSRLSGSKTLQTSPPKSASPTSLNSINYVHQQSF